jgi:hypothetical protein
VNYLINVRRNEGKTVKVVRNSPFYRQQVKVRSGGDIVSDIVSKRTLVVRYWRCWARLAALRSGIGGGFPCNEGRQGPFDGEKSCPAIGNVHGQAQESLLSVDFALEVLAMYYKEFDRY